MKLSRRDVLKTSAAAAAGAVFAQPLKAAAPEATPVTPVLIEAARREGKLAFYTALELNISEKLGKAFEAKYPGIAVRVERSGAERIFQRIGQEQDSRINAVDLVCSTDPAHFHLLETQGLDRALCAGGGRQEPAARAHRSGRHQRHRVRVVFGDRLQHRPGQAGGCAEKRSEERRVGK